MSRGEGRFGALLVVTAVATAPITPVRSLVQRADDRLLAGVVAHRRTAWRRPARLLTVLGEPPIVVPVWAGTAAWALAGGVPAARVLRSGASAAAGIALRRGLAEASHRSRPRRLWWWATPSGFSYPSRHVTWAVLGYGAVSDLMADRGRPERGRVLLAGAASLTSVTRVVLALHWPSDVAAALALATAWRRLTGAPRGGVHGPGQVQE